MKQGAQTLSFPADESTLTATSGTTAIKAGGVGATHIGSGVTKGGLAGGMTANPTAGATQYWPINTVGASGASEAGAETLVPFACTIKNLRVRNRGATAGGSTITLTVRINGAGSTLTVTVGASVGAQTLTSDTTHTAAVSAGDRICIEGVSGATGPGTTFDFSLELVST